MRRRRRIGDQIEAGGMLRRLKSGGDYGVAVHVAPAVVGDANRECCLRGQVRLWPCAGRPAIRAALVELARGG